MAHPRCHALTTKSDHYQDETAERADPAVKPGTACWCCMTSMDALGPDGDLVAPEECRPGRACYAPAGDQPDSRLAQ